MASKKSWDNKKQRFKNAGSITNAAKMNKQLLELETLLMEQFAVDHMTGDHIDALWLKEKIAKHFNRPVKQIGKNEDLLANKFFVDFCDSWTKKNLDTGLWRNIKTKKPLAPKSVNHYKNAVNLVRRYEESRKTRLKNKDLTIDFSQDFILFLINDDGDRVGYGQNYASRTLTRIKFFCARAEENNIDINKHYRSNQFSTSKEQTFDPYLNPFELKKIFEQDLSDNDKLDNARDWLIIGTFTGLRASDLLKLTSSNIESGLIHNKNKKTGTSVAIPTHDYVKQILNKRNGEFPRKLAEKNFNLYIKEVCEKVGINEMITAKIKNPETNRKELKEYEKYKAISSHICRRSFATNHYGKLPTSDLMRIGGWKTESAFLTYIKKSGFESAAALKNLWDADLNETLKIAN